MEDQTPYGSAPSAPPPPPLRPTPSPYPAPSYPPPRRRSIGWIIVLILVLSVLGVGLGGLLLLGTLGSMSMTSTVTTSPRALLQEVVVEDNGSRNKIALLDLTGIISSTAWDRSGYNLVKLIRHQLELAGEDSRVRAVVLVIDSPGGEVLASDEIYRAIREFQEEQNKPVIASMQSLAASGGYYAAAPCRWIVAHELTLTGSIGVVLHGYNYRGLMDKVGVRPEVYKSGRFKDMLSGDKREEDISPEERRMAQAIVDETFARFKEVVREGRTAAQEFNGDSGRSLSSDWEDYADGRILSGSQAYDQGFIDELGNLDQAIERARTIAGISNANLIRYARPFDISSLFRLFGESEGQAAATVKIDLGMDLPKLQAGRLYFLAPALFP